MYLHLNKYRIIHLSKYYPPYWGGIENHVRTLATSQVKLGLEVYVICINHLPSEKITQEWDEGVKVIRVNRVATIGRFDLCPGIATELRKLLKHSHMIVHIHTPNPTMLLALVRITQTMSLVITHHSDVIKQKILKYGLRPFEILVYYRSKKILTTSAQYIEGSRFLKTLYRNKMDFLPLALEATPYIFPSQEAIAYAEKLKEVYGSPLWLSVGRLTYYKAYPIAIEALKYVEGKLLIIGVGSLEQELKAFADRVGVSDRLIWLGSVSQTELIGAYHAATALWFPSNQRSEGFGMVQIEAMASGCPVINADIPGSGVPWVSRHNQEGLTIPLHDPQALAAAAYRLWQEPGLRDRLVQASRERAKYFDPMTLAQKSLDFYQAVVSQENHD